MRKVSTLVAMALMTLGASARAQGPDSAAPGANPSATPAPAPVAVPPLPPPPFPGVPPTPAAAPLPPAPVVVLPATTPAPPERNLQLGASVLAMGLGTFTSSPGGMTVAADASFSYGFGLLAAYQILPGLSLGLAPQAIYNVGPKEGGSGAAREYDGFARVAYSLTLVETIALYVEGMPGYSLIIPPNGGTAKGLVLNFGGGCSMDLGDRSFVSVGVGYQVGFQKVAFNTATATETITRQVEAKSKYVRLALSAGVKF